MKMKTSELTGAALDWAVAKCEGWSDEGLEDIANGDTYPEHDFSTDWAQGGPIIERERIRLDCWDFHSMPWKAAMWWDDERSSGDIQMYGPTPPDRRHAVLRCQQTG